MDGVDGADARRNPVAAGGTVAGADRRPARVAVTVRLARAVVLAADRRALRYVGLARRDLLGALGRLGAARRRPVDALVVVAAVAGRADAAASVPGPGAVEAAPRPARPPGGDMAGAKVNTARGF